MTSTTASDMFQADSSHTHFSQADFDKDKLNELMKFLLELDKLKAVQRRNYINHDGSTKTRLENSAEHSWHLAMACWTVTELFKLRLNHERLLKMALVHDLGEIDAGDTFLYDTARSSAAQAERMGLERLQYHAGNGIPDLLRLWDEQENGNSVEAKLIKVVDRILPFLLNIHSSGGAWTDHDVKREQVEKALAFIASDFPQIHDWLAGEIEKSVAQGWLN